MFEPKITKGWVYIFSSTNVTPSTFNRYTFVFCAGWTSDLTCWVSIPPDAHSSLTRNYASYKQKKGNLVVWDFVICIISSLHNQTKLLYLATQIRFLIGWERVTCHWSKLNDALGRTKLNDALGKQQLEPWTRTWSRCAPWNRGKFVYRSAWCKKPLK